MHFRDGWVVSLNQRMSDVRFSDWICGNFEMQGYVASSPFVLIDHPELLLLGSQT